MGTTAEKLNKLLVSKADIKSALTEKGRTPNDVLATYADEIRAIETCPDDALFLETVSAPAAVSTAAEYRTSTYGNGTYVAIGYGSDIVAYSNDGANWTDATMPTSGSWLSVTYGDNKFVAVGYKVAAFSEDGVTWTAITTLDSTRQWQSVTYGAGKFVTVAYGSTKTAYSTDGINWTESTISSNSANWNSVTYGVDKFVAVAYGSTKTAYSSDGVTWTETTLLPTSTNWYSVVYGEGKFVATASTTNAAYSEDGINWTAAIMPTSAHWRSVTYGAGKFVAVNSSGSGAYSLDGITWTAVTFSTTVDRRSVVYGNGMFVSVPAKTVSKVVVISYDGIEWRTSIAVTAITNVNDQDVTEETVQATGLLDPELTDQDATIAELQEILSNKARAFISITNDGTGNVVITTNGASATYSNGNLTIKQKG